MQFVSVASQSHWHSLDVRKFQDEFVNGFLAGNREREGEGGERRGWRRNEAAKKRRETCTTQRATSRQLADVYTRQHKFYRHFRVLTNLRIAYLLTNNLRAKSLRRVRHSSIFFSPHPSFFIIRSCDGMTLIFNYSLLTLDKKFRRFFFGIPLE